MLDPDQPYFNYASHDLDLIEAEAVLAGARHRTPVQMPELKAARLLSAHHLSPLSPPSNDFSSRYP